MCTLKKKKFLTNSGIKKSAPSQRDPPAKIVLANFLRQKDSKRLYVVSLHCWRCVHVCVRACMHVCGYQRIPNVFRTNSAEFSVVEVSIIISLGTKDDSSSKKYLELSSRDVELTQLLTSGDHVCCFG